MSKEEVASAQCSAAKWLVTWRWIYGCLLALGVFPFLIWGNREVGAEPGWYLLLFGVVPTVVVLVLSRVLPRQVCQVALIHDCALLALLIVLLATLPNYLGLVFLSPLAPFIVEGLVLLCVLGSRKPGQSSVLD